MQTAVALCLVIVLTAILSSVLVSIYTRRLSIKNLVTIIIGTIALLPIGVVLLNFGHLRLDGYAIGHLEENARKVVTGDELQAWAANVLAHPDDHSLQTNYPSALRRVHPLRPPRTSICTNLYDPPFVTLDWNEVDIRA